MDDVRAGLEGLHRESFGWALCCCRRDGARAEEVLQRVYLKVLSGAARHEGKGSFRTWLFAVIRRTAQDDRRREWLRRLRLGEWGSRRDSATAAPAGEAAEESERRARFLAALGALPGRQREVLHLVFYQGLSVAEAATVLEITVGTARTHYERGKEALRQTLQEWQVQDEHGRGRTAATGAVQ